MVAPAEARVGTFTEPPCPLTPELRSDIAYKRAHGHPWEAVGVTLNYNSDALRRATENDPEYAAVQEKAWADATFEGEAHAMGRLRLMVSCDDEDRALRAAEVLVKYARERRRDDTRLAVEKLRAETQRAKAEVKTARAEHPAERELTRWEKAPDETPAQRDQRDAEGAARPTAEVYVWGGKHPLERCFEPDASDERVRLITDYSLSRGGSNVVYWVVSKEPLEERLAPAG